MAKNSDAMNNEPLSDATINRLSDRDEIRSALLRLRRLGEKLPPVDAAVVVSEGREMANKSNEQ
jgi:hypothetical protein